MYIRAIIVIVETMDGDDVIFDENDFPVEPGGYNHSPRQRESDPNEEQSSGKRIRLAPPKLNFKPPSVPTITNTVNTIPTSNSFDALNNNVHEHEYIRSNVPNNSNGVNEQPRMPPITVFNISMTDLKEIVRAHVPNVLEHISYRLTQKGIKMFVKNVDAFRMVRKLLITLKINFFSHPLSDEKTRKFVVYGLNQMSNDVLKASLSEHGIVPCEIGQLHIKNRRYDDQTIYVLHFRQGDSMTLEKLRTVRAIESLIVKFEHYSYYRNGVTQCSNCQNFAHGARNCFLPPRCIRCGGDHSSSKCDKLLKLDDPKSTIPKTLVKCANCKGPHTANFEKCPERVKYLQLRDQLRNNLRNKKPNLHFQRSYNNNSNTNRNFQRPPHTSSSPTYADMLKTTNDLFTPNQCYSIFKRFLNEIKRCQTKEQQIDTIAKLTFEYLSNNECP